MRKYAIDIVYDGKVELLSAWYLLIDNAKQAILADGEVVLGEFAQRELLSPPSGPSVCLNMTKPTSAVSWGSSSFPAQESHRSG